MNLSPTFKQILLTLYFILLLFKKKKKRKISICFQKQMKKMMRRALNFYSLGLKLLPGNMF